MGKLYLMNAAVLPPSNFGRYEYREATADDLKAVVYGSFGRYESRIGYEQNVKLIREWTGVTVELNRDTTFFNVGDKAIVMRLICRLQNPSEKGKTLTDPEWELAWIERIS